MDESLLIHFSQSNESLNNLIEALIENIGTTLNTRSFQSEFELVDFVINHPDTQQIQFVVLEIRETNRETSNFIKNLGQLLPGSLIIVVSDSNKLIQLQNEFLSSDSLFFINRSWKNEDLQIAVNSAKSYYYKLQILLKSKLENSKTSKQKDEKTKLETEEISNSNIVKDKFFSIIAHDLKTPFASLIGITDILIKSWNELTDLEKLDLVKSLKSSSENTFILLDNLLIWSKSQMDKMDVVPEVIDIKSIINSAVEINESLANQKGVTIENRIIESIQVVADKEMISTVWRNLISNAVKHVPTGRKVVISAREKQNYCTFCIEDNGTGVLKEYIIDYFKFENIGVSADASKIRTLGLILCKEFVERNGGQIWLESEKNKGSKFYFKLPCL